MRTSNLPLAQNSIHVFVSMNTTIQVKVITNVIYINLNHDMFQFLLSHHQIITVYLAVY
jgi:hypothetical protein